MPRQQKPAEPEAPEVVVEEKAQGPGQTSTPNVASGRRADWLRALEEEKRGYEVRGLDDRAAQVQAQIDQFNGDVKGRKAPEGEQG